MKISVDCAFCGKPFLKYPAATRKRFCSHDCHNRSMFKHGLNASGYRLVNHGGRQVYEHRVVMEQHLGRKLSTWEHVHHVNGDKADNRLSNLEIMDASAHHREHVKPTFDVDEAYRLYETGIGYRKLSMRFGVARQNIMGLFIRRGWHVTGRTRTTLKAQYGK